MTDPAAPPLTDREPVALAGAISAVIPAVVAVLAAFGIWHPTEAQIAAVGGLIAAVIAMATALARRKAWSPASVARETADSTAAAAAAVLQRDQVLTILKYVAEPKSFSPPVELVEAIAPPAPPAPATGGDTTALMRISGLLGLPTRPRQEV